MKILKTNNIHKLLLLVIGLLLTFALSSCKLSYLEYEMPPYDPDFEVHDNSKLDKDEGIEIDGVLDEDIWLVAENNAFSSVSKFKDDIELFTKCYITEKGVYFGMTVYDYAVYYNADRTPAYNTSAEIYFCGVDTNQFYNIRLVPTGNGCEIAPNRISWKWSEDDNEWKSWKLKWEGAATVQGTMNTSTCQGYTAEVFIPWETIGEPSDYIRYMIGFNHVESTSVLASERTWTGTPGCKNQLPSTWKMVSNEGIHDHDEIMDSFIKCDDSMTIDGNLDENIWADKESVVYDTTLSDGDNVSMEAKYYGTDKGAYFGIVVKDNDIFYADESVRAIGLNSGLELMFAPAGVDHVTLRCAQLRITANGEIKRYTGWTSSYPWQVDYFKCLSATTIQGELNAEDTSSNEGYTIEIFIPWDVLGLDEQPESVLLGASLIHTENATTASKTSPWQYINFMAYEISLAHNPSVSYAELTNNGPVYKTFEAPLINVIDDDIVDGYYTKTVQFTASPTIVKAGCNVKNETIVPSLVLPEGVEYTVNNDETITIKIPVSQKEECYYGLKYTAEYKGTAKEGEILYNPIKLDGRLDDQIYENIVSYHSGRAGRTQDIKVVISRDGLYLAINVVDPNMKADSRIETWLSLGDKYDENNKTHYFRFYPLDSNYPNGRVYVWDDSVNASNGHDFREMTSRGYEWISKTIPVVENGENVGYTAEAFIPYSSLGLTEAPESVRLISVQFYWTATGSAISSGHSDEISFKMAQLYEYVNYQTYDSNGWVYPLSVNDVTLDNVSHLTNGFYHSDFTLQANSKNVISNITFSGNGSEYITELGNGKYRISIPESKKFDFVEAQTIVATDIRGNTTEFTIQISEIDATPEVEINFDNGTIVNTGSKNDVTVGQFVTNGTNGTNKNSTAFVETENMTFTTGLNGEVNGAAVTNHYKGPYTVVQGMNLGTGDFTVSVWFNIPDGESVSTGNSTYIFGNATADFKTNKGFRTTIRYVDGQYLLNVRTAGCNGEYQGNVLNMQQGEWHLLTVVRQGTTVSYYFDSTLIKSQTIAENYDFGTYDIGFGGNIGETWAYKDNSICFDNIRIYDRAVSENELSEFVRNDKIAQ